MFYLNLSAQEKRHTFTERFGVRLLTSYGMTETIVGYWRPSGDKRRWPSIGRVGLAMAEIRDDKNRPLPPEMAKSW